MAISTNFLKTNSSLISKGIDKLKDLQQAEQEGRTKLEGKFPKQVSNPSEVHFQVEYVNINGQNYAVIGYPTYRQNGQGTFDFVSMTCEVIPGKEGSAGIPLEDKSKIEWYSGSLDDSVKISGPDMNKPRFK